MGHGFDYWALGHIHQRQVHAEAPFVVMPGIPQGRDIGEAGPKSVTLVEVSEAGIVLEERMVALAEFCRAEVRLLGPEDWQETLRLIRSALEVASNAAQAEQAICRVELQGASSLGWRLRRDADLLAAEVKDAAEQIGHIWIDRIENKIVLPAKLAEDADPVDELQVLMDEVSTDGAFRAEAAEHLDQIIRALPAELRDRYGHNESSTAAVLDRLIADGTKDVIAALKTGQVEREAL